MKVAYALLVIAGGLMLGCLLYLYGWVAFMLGTTIMIVQIAIEQTRTP